MPSDCQCSTACTHHTEVVKEVKVLNNKEATRKIKKLEKEVEELRMENARLATEAKKNKMTKKKLVDQLEKKLREL